MKISETLKGFIKEQIAKEEENKKSWNALLKILPDEKNDISEYYLGLYKAGNMICDLFTNNENKEVNRNEIEGARLVIEELKDFCEIKKEVNVLIRLIAIEKMCSCFLTDIFATDFDLEKDFKRPLRIFREKYNKIIIHEA